MADLRAFQKLQKVMLYIWHQVKSQWRNIETNATVFHYIALSPIFSNRMLVTQKQQRPDVGDDDGSSSSSSSSTSSSSSCSSTARQPPPQQAHLEDTLAPSVHSSESLLPS